MSIGEKGEKMEENKKRSKSGKKIRFYVDRDSCDLAFATKKTFNLFVKGLEILGVPHQVHAGRLVGNRLHIDGKHIYCVSRDGDWEIFVKFQGKLELSLEIKDGGKVFVSYPDYLDRAPYIQQEMQQSIVVAYIEKEVVL